MMRKTARFVCFLTLLLCLSCAKKVTLPIKTSLGDLTKIEKKDKVTTNKDPVTPKPGEVIYVLSFEGKKQYEVKGVAAPELMSFTGGLTDNSDIKFDDFHVSSGVMDLGSVLNLPMVDSSGKQFNPAFFGTPGADGVISNSAVRFNGHVTGKDGKPWVSTGKFDFPEARVTVVYAVPENATLTLRDGGQQHAIN